MGGLIFAMFRQVTLTRVVPTLSRRVLTTSFRPYVVKFTRDHEWVDIQGNEATVGITDYAQQQLGEIVFSEVSAEVGSQVEAGEAFGEVESVKSSSELLSPLSGTISEINSLVVENPKILNQAPEGEGWIVKMENFDEENGDLMDEEAYKDYISTL